tara:strand:+ start:351 stop:560 length:210 start_codon:yes stop_codon:yes gene_type:complete
MLKEAGVVGGVILLVAVAFIIQPLIIFCLWDDVMVKFFDLQDVTFMDSIWISLLFSCLFKGNLSCSNNK